MDLRRKRTNVATPARRCRNPRSAGDANRARTCETTLDPFVPYGDEVVVDDSCDEYPFAKTYEGGTLGSQCADVVGLDQGDGSWQFYQANPDKPVTLNEPCIRGHVPLSQNSAAGGKYGSFVPTDRVLDLEKFTVLVTA
ncbi:NucA/NucB deoxyribonuclease domain-containing protein [Actinoplanes sp. CA-054009]